MSSVPADAPKPRLCQVRKRTPEEEYGFNLHAEKSKGQFIGAVDSGSPAQVAGLRPGDRIIGVNGVSVVNEPHKQLVTKIKENALSCDLIVVDEDTFAWYNDRNIPIPVDPEFTRVVDSSLDKWNGTETSSPIGDGQFQTPPEHADSPITDCSPPSYQETLDKTPPTGQMRPRLCTLVKPDGNAEFGFNLHAEKNSGHFIGKVDEDSIGERAGLEQGQRIVGVNGVLVYSHTSHRDVVSLIKANPLRVELLVASPEVDIWYNNNGLEYDFGNAERVETVDGGLVSKSAELPISNGSSANGDSGIVNVDKNEETMTEEVKAITLEPVGDEQVEVEVEPSQGDLEPVPLEQSPVQSTQPQPESVEAYATIVDNPRESSEREPDWLQLSAAQLRERVGQHKKVDPRTQQISLQEKHDLIRNM